MVLIRFPYVAHAETRRMVERLVEQGRLGKHWLERPSLAAYSHESYIRIKGRVLARDHYTCQYCGATDVDLACDHIIPRSRGGMTHPDNLVAACTSCNSAKHNKTLEEWLLEPPKMVRTVSQQKAAMLSNRLAFYCRKSTAHQFCAFLSVIHTLNKQGMVLASRTSTLELATLMGCKKWRVAQLREYGIKHQVLLFAPDLSEPGAGWYGINPHHERWIAPDHGGARVGAGKRKERQERGPSDDDEHDDE